MATKFQKDPMFLFYIVCLVFFVILSAAGLFWVKQERAARSRLSVMTTRPALNLALVSLPRVTISIGNGGRGQMNLDMSLEVEKKDVSVVEGYVPQVLDRLNGFFPRVDFYEVEHSRSMILLRNDMLWQINSIGMPVQVRDLIIQKMVIM